MRRHHQDQHSGTEAATTSTRRGHERRAVQRKLRLSTAAARSGARRAEGADARHAASAAGAHDDVVRRTRSHGHELPDVPATAAAMSAGAREIDLAARERVIA